MIKPASLLVATNNRGKLREYAELLKGLPFELVTLSERGITEEVEETGSELAALLAEPPGHLFGQIEKSGV